MAHQQPAPSSSEPGFRSAPKVGHEHRRRALLVLAVLGLAAAACGGGAAGSSVASLGATTTTTRASDTNVSTGGQSTSDDALKFSQCMRSHGVANFPDPTMRGGRPTIQAGGGPGSGLDPNSPQFQAAQSACQHLLPKGGRVSPQQQAQAEDAALHFAQCMRAHGINVPDPQTSTNAGGGMQVKIGPGAGVDPNSPQFQAAQSACQHFLPFHRIGGGGQQKASSGGGGVSAGSSGAGS
jgi:hypothetical protein